MVAVIEETVVCMHGGLSPSLSNLEDLNQIQRPCEIPEEGLLCDLVWADPDPDVTVSKCRTFPSKRRGSSSHSLCETKL